MKVTGDQGEVELTHAEGAIFQAYGRGWRTSEIARQANRSIKTIDTHLHNTCVKLGITSNARLRVIAATWLATNKGQSDENPGS